MLIGFCFLSPMIFPWARVLYIHNLFNLTGKILAQYNINSYIYLPKMCSVLRSGKGRTFWEPARSHMKAGLSTLVKHIAQMNIQRSTMAYITFNHLGSLNTL